MTKYEEMISRVQPDPDMIPWLQGQGLLCREALIYEKDYVREPITGEKRVACRCICSGCGERFYDSYVPGGGCCYGSSVPYGVVVDTAPLKGGDITTCPECGREVEVMYGGWFSHYSDGARMIQGVRVQELRVIEGFPVLLKWYCRSRVNKMGRSRIKADLEEAFLFEKKKAVRVNKSGMFCGNYYSKQAQETKRCVDDFGSITHLFPFPHGLLDGTSLENSKLEEYLQCKGSRYPVSYLRLYQRWPEVENLLTCGAGDFLADLLGEEWRSYSGYSNRCCQRILQLEELNRKEVRPCRMLGLNKEELGRLIREEWKVKEWRLYVAVRDRTGLRLRKEDLKTVSLNDAKEIMEMGLPLRKTMRYLSKQKQSLQYLKDYLDMGAKIGYDVRDPAVLYPKSLQVAHDRVMQLQKEKEMEELREAFSRRRAFLQLLAWEQDGILIRPVEDQKELIAEGKALHHCVGTYAKTHGAGECSILLIRRAEAPEVPWYTLNFNVKTGRVTENRGNRNCDRTEEIKAFEQAWLEHIRPILKKLQRAAKKGKEKVA